MPDLWELPDEELWGQLDASLLEDEFRASEAADLNVRLAFISPGACATFARALIESAYAFQTFAEQIGKAARSIEMFLAGFDQAPEHPPREQRTSSQPRTLHLALKANARPVQSCRAARREWRRQGRG